MIDIDQVRADTPAVKFLTHFNNAGASLMPTSAYRAMLEYLQREQEIGGYETVLEYVEQTADFYVQAARSINASPAEIAFCESATKAWQLFFYSIPFKRGDRIITTQLDYGSNFVGFIQQHNRLGVEVVVIETDSNGDIDLVAMEREIDDRARLVSLSHIPTANGIINPAAQVGQIAKSAGVPYLLDACQSIGQIDVDVKQIGCSALSVTGRKYLRGPRGTGFLYVDENVLANIEPGWLDQRGVVLRGSDQYELLDSAKRFENFEVGFGARIGFGNALKYFNQIGAKNVEQRIIKLGTYCREKLHTVSGVSLHDNGAHRSGIVTFTLEGHTPVEIRRFLNQHKINIWACAGPGSLVDFQRRGIDSVARASVHYFNTEEEIEKMVASLSTL